MLNNGLQFVDLSSNNAGPFNLKAHYEAGHRVLALKVSEDTTYVWAEHAVLADVWHKLGGIVWHYHFARPGRAAAQAASFVKALAGHLEPSDRLIVDCEVAGVNGVFVDAFLTQVHKAHPKIGLGIYGSPYFLRDNNIKPPKGLEALLWLADYAGAIALVPPGWTRVDAWQYTDDATGVAGIPGKVDATKLHIAEPVGTTSFTDDETKGVEATIAFFGGIAAKRVPLDDAASQLAQQLVRAAHAAVDVK